MIVNQMMPIEMYLERTEPNIEKNCIRRVVKKIPNPEYVALILGCGKEVRKWCQDNCSGKVVKGNAIYWFFEKKSDAIYFSLRWS